MATQLFTVSVMSGAGTRPTIDVDVNATAPTMEREDDGRRRRNENRRTFARMEFGVSLCSGVSQKRVRS